MNTRVTQLLGLPVISLQTSETVAVTGPPIIDMATFDVLALTCSGIRTGEPLLLLARDVRQLAPDCVIVDSEEDLTGRDDVVRLQPFLKADYSPLGKGVVTESGQRLGNVDDFSINLDSSQVQQLFLARPWYRPWITSGHVIDRRQIIDITIRQITVSDATAKARLLPADPLGEV